MFESECLNFGGTEQDVAIVMAADPALRALGKETLRSVLPEYLEIVEADSSDKVLLLISGISERIALIMTFDEADKHARRLAVSLFIDDGKNDKIKSKVPLFLVTTEESFGDGYVENLAEVGFVDGVVSMPLRSSEVLESFKQALINRSDLLPESESAAKTEVLKKFVDYYSNLVGIWKEKVLKLSLAPNAGETVVENTPQQFIESILVGINGIIKILEELNSCDLAKIETNVLKGYIHGLKARLGLIIAYPDFLRNVFGLTRKDEEILAMVEREAHQLSLSANEISTVYNGASSWQNVKHANKETIVCG